MENIISSSFLSINKRKKLTYLNQFFSSSNKNVSRYNFFGPSIQESQQDPLGTKVPPSPSLSPHLSLSLPLQLAFPWGCPLPFQFYFSLTPPFYSWKSTEKACQSPSPRSISGSGGNLVFLSSEPTSIYYIYQEKNVKDKNSNFNYLHLNSFFELQMQ